METRRALPRAAALKTMVMSLALLAWHSSLGTAALRAQTAPLTLIVDAATTITSFHPLKVFGVNTAYWVSKADNLAAQPLVEGAGNYFLRYPGGGQSDNYHWNGTGAFDASGRWVPNDTTYSGGFEVYMKYRGTTSPFTNWVDWSSNLVDGDLTSAWMSNADTNFPNHQWVELDLTGKFSPGGVTFVRGVTIVWGSPSAAAFQVQYWSGPSYPPPYMSAPESLWITTSSGTVAGAGDGTTQGVTFNQVSAEYIRILMTSSTAGAGGVYSISEIYVHGPSGQVSRNTATQTNYLADQTWAAASSTDNASTFHRTPDFNFEDYMAYCRSFTPHAVPLITINLGTGTAQEAAAWVHYANVVRGYGIKYWQAGNEINGRWETGGPVNAADHVKRFVQYYDAMKAVDPSILVVGPLTGGNLTESSNLYDGKSFLEDYIAMTAAAGVSLHGDANHYFDAIDFHWYPFWGSFTAAQALAAPAQLDSLAPALRGLLTSAGVTGVADIPFIMSEYNSTADEQNFNLQLGNGLFVAETLGHFITAFGPGGHANLWAVMNGGTGATVPGGGDPGYLNRFNDGYHYQPRSSYWAMKMMTNYWAIPADTRGHSLVQSSVQGASTAQLTAYSNYRPDGVLSLAVVNKDPATSFHALVNVGPFAANDAASGWSFDSSNYQWVTTGAPPYHADPDTPPTAFSVTGTGGAFPVTFKPFSITVLQFTDSLLPTHTPAPTSTATLTPTITPTVYYGPVTLIDDFEDPAREGFPPNRTNLWNGPWGTSVDPTSSITISYGAPGADSTGRSTRARGVIGSVPTPGWSNFDTGLNAFDASGAGLVGIRFWFYGDGSEYRFCAMTSGVTDYNFYGVNLIPPMGVWTLVQIPFADMTRQPGWGTQTGLPATCQAHDVTGVQLKTQVAGGAFDYRVDQIGFYTAAGLTPTAVVTSSPTWTATPTPTVSPTSSSIPTATTTPSLTSSSTPTATPTPSPTPSPTSSPSPTETPTATFTATLTLVGPFGAAVPTLWPNPAGAGGGVHLSLNQDGPGPVRVRVFTTALRKLTDLTFHLPGGNADIEFPLADAGGRPFSNGLYHVVVDGSVRRADLKLVVLN